MARPLANVITVLTTEAEIGQRCCVCQALYDGIAQTRVADVFEARASYPPLLPLQNLPKRLGRQQPVSDLFKLLLRSKFRTELAAGCGVFSHMLCLGFLRG